MHRVSSQNSARRRFRACLLAGVATVSLLSTALPRAGVAAAGLLPHVAYYNLTKKRADQSSGIAAVKGRMQIRFNIFCDGFEVDQYLGFRVMSNDASQLEHLAYLSSFEDVDGRKFKFDARAYEDRRLAEELGGIASLKEAGPGETRYTRPAPLTETLPENTLFPVKHLQAIIEAARAGRRSLRSTVFDGSSKDNPYEISTFIGPGSRSGDADVGALRGRTFWPVRLAYYKVGTVTLSPEFEMSAHIYDNGVIGDMVYDYGNFAINVTLEQIETLNKPDC